MKVTSERIERLRYFARIERTAVLEYFGRMGEDPLTTLADLPTVDELVVRELRDATLEDRGQFTEFTMARLAATGNSDDAAKHRVNADRVEFELLREIAIHVPELAIAAWSEAGRLNVEPEN